MELPGMLGKSSHLRRERERDLGGEADEEAVERLIAVGDGRVAAA
jgi:hypothetical protein